MNTADVPKVENHNQEKKDHHTIHVAPGRLITLIASCIAIISFAPTCYKTVVDYNLNKAYSAYFHDDYEQAARIYKVFSAGPFPSATATNNLGMCYLNGYGVDYNYDRAIELFEESYILGHNDTAKGNIISTRICRENDEDKERLMDLFKNGYQDNDMQIMAVMESIWSGHLVREEEVNVSYLRELMKKESLPKYKIMEDEHIQTSHNVLSTFDDGIRKRVLMNKSGKAGKMTYTYMNYEMEFDYRVLLDTGMIK